MCVLCLNISDCGGGGEHLFVVWAELRSLFFFCVSLCRCWVSRPVFFLLLHLSSDLAVFLVYISVFMKFCAFVFSLGFDVCNICWVYQADFPAIFCSLLFFGLSVACGFTKWPCLDCLLC